jgi:hypothetical protein
MVPKMSVRQRESTTAIAAWQRADWDLARHADGPETSARQPASKTSMPPDARSEHGRCIQAKDPEAVPNVVLVPETMLGRVPENLRSPTGMESKPMVR